MSRWSRALLWLGAAAMGLFGVVSFVAPAWAAERFPWSVVPLLAQTIGGWSIGAAAYAALAARDGRPWLVYPLMVHLAVFGVGELLVVITFRDKLVIDVLTWPYLLGLSALAVGASGGLVDRLRTRSAPDGDRGPLASMWMRATALAFAAFVAVLALGTFLSGPDGAVAQGRYFPEPVTLFSVRAFSAFFLAITLSASTALVERRLWPLLMLLMAGTTLVVLISVASLLHLDVFEFREAPGQVLYLGVYVGSAALFLAILLRYRAEVAALLRSRPGPTT